MNKVIGLVFQLLFSICLFGQEKTVAYTALDIENNKSNAALVAFESSNLPIIVINTDGNEIVDEPRIIANMGVIWNGVGLRNSVNDAYNNYNGKISIEIRGQSSQMFPKKSYGFETQDGLGANLNVSLLGMPKENDWILYAPYTDKSMMRNVFTYHLGSLLGQYVTRTAYCELIINGSYEGIYVLLEKIKKDDNRVSVSTLKAEDVSGDDVTGGYVIKVDKTNEGYNHSTDGWKSRPDQENTDFKNVIFQYVYPGANDIVEEQKDYIQDFILDAENALLSKNFADHDLGYNQYFNVSSFIDFMLLAELSKEVDKYRYSTYFYKKKNDKGNELYAGPIWDFNLGYGNEDYWPFGLSEDGWVYNEHSYDQMYWWERLGQDPFFQDLAATRWDYLRKKKFSNGNIDFLIDSISTYLEEAQERNFERWPILGTYVWPNYKWRDMDYTDEIEYFDEWLYRRLFWLDDNFPGKILNPFIGITSVIDESDDGFVSIGLRLKNDYFTSKQLRKKYFSLKGEPEGVDVDTIIYLSATEATLVIKTKYSFDSFSNNVAIEVDDNILNGFRDLRTSSLLVSVKDAKALDDMDVSVYSSRNKLIITTDNYEKLPSKIQLYNVMGQLVDQYSLNKQAYNEIETTLVSDIYLVKIVMDGQPFVQRILLGY